MYCVCVTYFNLAPRSKGNDILPTIANLMIPTTESCILSKDDVREGVCGELLPLHRPHRELRGVGGACKGNHMPYPPTYLALPCPLICLALISLALICLALPCLALPCLALPCLALPCSWCVVCSDDITFQLSEKYWEVWQQQAEDFSYMTWDDDIIKEDENLVGAYYFDKLALPYLPYFSNCDGYDSYIPIIDILENPQVSLTPIPSSPVPPFCTFFPLP